MARRHVTTFSDGTLSAIDINADGVRPYETRLAKTMFELSREMLPPDGRGRIMPRYPLEKFDPEIHSCDAIARGIARHVPLACREIDDSELPAGQVDRETGRPIFREAWTDTGTAIVVDMPKARIIHMARIVVATEKELKKKAIEWFKADAAGKTVIDAEKQVLQDLPQTFDLSNAPNVTALEALWPPEIRRP